MTDKIDKGMSMLNGTDETANPYGSQGFEPRRIDSVWLKDQNCIENCINESFRDLIKPHLNAH